MRRRIWYSIFVDVSVSGWRRARPTKLSAICWVPLLLSPPPSWGVAFTVRRPLYLLPMVAGLLCRRGGMVVGNGRVVVRIATTRPFLAVDTAFTAGVLSGFQFSHDFSCMTPRNYGLVNMRVHHLFSICRLRAAFLLLLLPSFCVQRRLRRARAASFKEAICPSL